MAINLTTPTVRPPKAADMFGPQAGAPATYQGSQAAATTPTIAPPTPKATPQVAGGGNVGAPQAAPQYKTAPKAFQGQNLSPALENFARSTLNAPSRFDIGTVQQGTQLIDQDLQKQGQKARRGLDEFMSQRGTVGSSIEAEQQRELASDLENQRMQRLFDLNMALAQTQATDRQTAANIGTQVGSFQRDLGLDELNEGRYAAEFGRLTGRDAEDDIRARAGLQLQSGAQQFGQELAGAQFGLSGAELAQRERMQEREIGASREFQQADIQARTEQLATQIQAEAAAQGRQITAEQAMQEAGIRAQQESQGRELSQRASEFAATQSQRESEFARQYGLDGARFQQEQREFSAQMAEQVSARLQQAGQFTASLAEQHTQNAMQNAISQRSLDLQQQGMNRDDAFRYAQMQTETGLRQQALNLEQQGMTRDDAYRYAALSQDGTFKQMAMDLQKTGMNLDEAFRRAELGYRAWAEGEGLKLQARQANETSRLSELDILLRAMASGGDALAFGKGRWNALNLGAPVAHEITPFPGGTGTSGGGGGSGSGSGAGTGSGSGSGSGTGTGTGTGTQPSTQRPAGYNTIYGDGWHDGTPEGQAAFDAYNRWRSQSTTGAQQTQTGTSATSQAATYDPSKGGPTLNQDGSGTAKTQAEYDAQRMAYLDYLTKAGLRDPVTGGNTQTTMIPWGTPVEDPSDPWSTAEQRELARLERIYRGY